jgi:hypothetical protein
VQIEALPLLSVAVYLTCVVPKGNVAPGVCVDTNVTVPQLSVAVGAVQGTDAWHNPFAGTTMFEGHPVITGFILSTTVTVKEHKDEFPEPSVAVYVTVDTPTGNVAPGTLLLVNVESVQLSVAVGAVQLTIASQEEFAKTDILEGHPVITGSTSSFTVTVKEQFAVFP